MTSWCHTARFSKNWGTQARLVSGVDINRISTRSFIVISLIGCSFWHRAFELKGWRKTNWCASSCGSWWTTISSSNIRIWSATYACTKTSWLSWWTLWVSNGYNQFVTFSFIEIYLKQADVRRLRLMFRPKPRDRPTLKAKPRPKRKIRLTRWLWPAVASCATSAELRARTRRPCSTIWPSCWRTLTFSCPGASTD